jgi:hypothetical protein
MGAATPRRRAGAILLGGLEAQGRGIFEEGLHEFLTRFIGEVSTLGAVVHE